MTQSRAGNIHVLEETSAQLRKYFPDIPILPALGNHESVPVDSFPPPFVQGPHSIDWLYSALDRYGLCYCLLRVIFMPRLRMGFRIR